MLPYRARKVGGDELAKPREAEITAIVDHLVGVAGEPLEAVDEMHRVKAGPCQGEVLADPAIQRRETGARYGGGWRDAPLSAADRVQQRLELRPLLLVHLLEAKGRHHRPPRTHRATPSTRRVTSGPARPRSPETT